MALVQTNPDAYVIKPAASAPEIDTSEWPLLLKNYSKCTLQLPK
jgi:H/ACA ribonucleoprotein complex subunit 4